MPLFQVALITPTGPIYETVVRAGTQGGALRKALQQNNISLVIMELEEDR